MQLLHAKPARIDNTRARPASNYRFQARRDLRSLAPALARFKYVLIRRLADWRRRARCHFAGFAASQLAQLFGPEISPARLAHCLAVGDTFGSLLVLTTSPLPARCWQIDAAGKQSAYWRWRDKIIALLVDGCAKFNHGGAFVASFATCSVQGSRSHLSRAAVARSLQLGTRLG